MHLRTSRDPAPVYTSVPVTVATPSPLTPATTPVPYPNALSLNTHAGFGSDPMTGDATVYRYLVLSEYNWTAPSFNSPREQAASSGPFDTQYRYNNAKAKPGNTFLFIFVRVTDTGSKALYAPSAHQFVVSIDGKAYGYSPLDSPDATINGVSGTQDRFPDREGRRGRVCPSGRQQQR